MSVITEPAPAPVSAWAPLRHRAFAVLWAATVVSNVGTWMNDVGAGWLMTSLAPSPLMVALIQTATALPMFLFALPAGALADILDRRRMLIGVQFAMAMAALALGLTVEAGGMTPGLLLAFTFALGAGAAFLAPAWQSVVPSLVPREALTQAVALNSLGVNLSRAIGPAIGGAVLASLGAAWPFLLNAISFAGVIAALLWWRPPPAPERRLPPEGLAEAMIGGLRYAAASAPLKATLVRAVLFFLFASAYWALLPLIVRETLAGGPGLYGLLFGTVGAGAVLGALALPRLKRRLSGDRLVALGSAGTAATLVVFALSAHPAAALAASLLAGASWITVLSNLNVSAQTALPDWVRARGLALFITVFYGAMTAGSLLWGELAARLGIPLALLIAAAGLLAGLPMTRRFRLQQGAALDLSPSMHWPEPVVLAADAERRGPVLVTVEYPVDPAQAERFLALMRTLAAERRRDGAWGWSLQEDAASPGLWLETFREGDWTAHLRHHARVTAADRALQNDIRALMRDGAAPLVRHFLGPVRAKGDAR